MVRDSDLAAQADQLRPGTVDFSSSLLHVCPCKRPQDFYGRPIMKQAVNVVIAFALQAAALLAVGGCNQGGDSKPEHQQPLRQAGSPRTAETLQSGRQNPSHDRTGPSGDSTNPCLAAKDIATYAPLIEKAAKEFMHGEDECVLRLVDTLVEHAIVTVDDRYRNALISIADIADGYVAEHLDFAFRKFYRRSSSRAFDIICDATATNPAILPTICKALWLLRSRMRRIETP